MRILLPLLLAAMSALIAAPALAEGQRDAFDCSTMQSCAPGTACTEGGTDFGLAFLGGGIEVMMDGHLYAPVYDGDLRSTAWRHESMIYQMRITGDGGGVLTVTPETGDFTQARLEWLHCSPQ
ncbi:hypothetical protein JI664_15225 [Rhodobacter sp. NTK016B]|uniref:hypothetical protein n=1 Tax=Rhodobacter sp. NTK016B TaxID=2759676 RepID=UPI001A8CC516|nr:hypothetical protein [Rhodobacter sp. NTK016B]MBN8293325.1 hypothetical protein [Rhodobacter sp. NTK016B]